MGRGKIKNRCFPKIIFVQVSGCGYSHDDEKAMYAFMYELGLFVLHMLCPLGQFSQYDTINASTVFCNKVKNNWRAINVANTNKLIIRSM